MPYWKPPLLGSFNGQASLGGMPASYVLKAMSRSYKIALILKSRSSLPVYEDLSRLSDAELDAQVRSMVRRMRTNESNVIARLVLRRPTFSLN
jgi:hypothetical protein